MKRFLCLLSIFLIFIYASADLPEPLQPPRLVNDFIGLLASDQATQIEQQLLQFEKETSIQIAVVIIDHTEYDIGDAAQRIGQAWGVGQKHLDNGIVFLIAKGDRKMFIATGYGLESYMPDITCHRITENTVKPFFKSGDYTSGIRAGVDEIISTLGKISWDDRQAQQKLLKAKQEQEFQELLSLLGGLLIAVIFFGSFAFIVFRIRRRYLLGKEIGAKILSFESQYKKILADEIALSTRWPKWAQEEYRMHAAKYESCKKNANEKLKALPKSVWMRAKISEETLSGVKNAINAFDEIDQRVTKIREDVKFYEKHSAGALKELGDMLVQSAYFFNDAQEKGFTLSESLEEFKSVRDFVTNLQVTDADSHRHVFLHAFESKEKLNFIKKRVENEMAAKQSFDEKVSGVKKILGKVSDDIKKYRTSFESLHELFPLAALAGIPHPDTLNNHPGIIRALLEKGERIAEERKEGVYQIALAKLLEAVKFSDEVVDAREAMEHRSADLTQKANAYPFEKGKVEKRVRQAEGDVQDSDVEHDARESARKARSEFKKACDVAEKSGVKINWLIVYACLQQAKKFADQAIEGAEQDIQRAKRKRYSSLSSSSPSYSSSNYSGSSGSSSGGFGGFGGGSFGGGGGGSSW